MSSCFYCIERSSWPENFPEISFERKLDFLYATIRHALFSVALSSRGLDFIGLPSTDSTESCELFCKALAKMARRI